jgi:hypothetical protein
MLKNLLIVSVLAFLFGRPSVAQGQRSSPHTPDGKSSQHQQEVPPTHIVIDPPLPTPNRPKSESVKVESSSPEKLLPRFERPEWVAVYITAVYVLISWLTLRAVKRQADVANQTLIATFRPRLIVRRVLIQEGTPIPTQGVPDVRPWRVQYYIANNGGSVAHVTTCCFAISIFAEGLPANTPTIEYPATPPFSLRPGEEKKLFIPLGEIPTQLFRMMGGTRARYLEHQQTAFVYFWGYAQYTDDANVARNIAVMRHFQTDTAKFKAVDDPDYEYAD